MSASNPNDAIRTSVLSYFYDRNAKATSRFGKRGSAVRISDVKAELKALHSLTQQQVMSNLTYLTDRGWVKTVDETKTVTTRRGTTVPSKVTFYEISAEGIDRVEGGSDFELSTKYAGINITAMGSNVITLGDGNIVQSKYQNLYNKLSELKSAVAASHELNEEEKLSLSVDIESLTEQLAKPQPDQRVVVALWSVIEKAAAIATLAPIIAALAPQVQHLLR
jgi:hypothetical protein